jgi:hypothetical protein
VLQLPAYAFLGIAMLAVSEVAMFARIEPFWSWHTPIAWTGYILLIDGITYRKRGSSWLMTNRREFCFLALVSIPLWLVFEAYNLAIRNWHYVNLPVNPVARYLGYAWAFATIWPAIFETADLIAVFRRRDDGSRERAQGGPVPLALLIVGAAMLIWPIVRPSPYLAAPVWLGFIFLLDPLNYRARDESLIGDIRRGSWKRILNLIAAGFICGVLWEFWNYWARAKWIYTVPIMEEWRIFEMPLPGYFGFPAFALECFTMYVFVRRLLWRGRKRTIGILPS